MLDNIRVSARLLRIPISITGIIYVVIGLGTLFNLFRHIGEPGKLASLLPLVLLMALLAFVHYKAYYAVKSLDKVLLRSSSWSSLPNIGSMVFLALFAFVLLFILANGIALVVFLIGLIIYIFLIIASLGSMLGKEWFSFHYFTHYATGFWAIEHKALGYVLPNGHDQSVAIFLLVSLVLFVVPTLFSVFVLVFKHLVLDGDTSFSMFNTVETKE